jgi:hypothetical protein
MGEVCPKCQADQNKEARIKALMKKLLEMGQRPKVK